MSRPKRPSRLGTWPFAIFIASALVMLAAIAAPAAPAVAHEGERFTALVFSKTAGFRHGSIPDGIAAIRALSVQHNFHVDATEDAGAFTDANLSRYDVVIWLSTTGDVLNDAQQGAFERYIRGGGGYVGIHAASDTEYGWAWYGRLVGAYFNNHPAQQTATIKVEDPAHPSTAHLGSRWQRFDEWYNFRTNPRAGVHVLASLDESSYNPGSGAMGVDHPVSWCHDYDGGRAWYTALGHTSESFREPAFLDHLAGGIETAAGVVQADCTASLAGSFEKVALDESTSNPMKLDIADDGRVFYIDRGGAVRIIRPNGSTVTAGSISVYTGQEFGMLGIALDPDFATNNWVYLYYSPAGSRPIDRLSRFTMNGDTLNVGSQVTLLEVDTQRSECCHAGGALEFDNQGNLYLATGDNTNPFASSGYTPIDERPGRAFWDAQRTAANSNVLNGKVLRIHPEDNGSYTIPPGNLFAPGTPRTRPEIYAMGFRNPFTIGIDPRSGKLLLADYGPDAGSANPSRGPDGRVEWNIVDRAGFYGWPYCVGNNTPYIDYNFATGQSGSPFNCAGGPANNSPNNTGITQLPPAIPAKMWMGKAATGVPEIGRSSAPTAGGAYRFDPAVASSRKWPAYWDRKSILADWNNGRFFSVQLDDSGSNVVDVNPILAGMDFIRPHALKWGPDGALYVIDWGTGFGGNNSDSGVYRIDYLRGTSSRDPIAKLTVDKSSGPVPLTVRFSSAGSSDPEGTQLSYAWDFDGDGRTDSTSPEVSHTYTAAGTYLAALRVTTTDGRSAVADVEIIAGNTAPTITVHAPVAGGLFDFGDYIRYRVTVTDPEDGQIDCNRVVTQPALGHDEHAHPYEQYFGCEGVFPLPGDGGHIGANIFGVVTVTYTDRGGPGGAKPLTSQKVVVLHTKDKQAEYFTRHGRVPGGIGSDEPGVRVENTTDVNGGQNVASISDGDYFGFTPMNLTRIDAVELRVASASVGGTIEVHVDDPQGPLVGSAVVNPTGGWQNWTTVRADLTNVPAGGGSSLYFVTRAPAGSGNTGFLVNVNWMRFLGVGISEDVPTRRYEAEAGTIGGGTSIESDHAGFTGTGYVNFPANGGWLQFNNVNGGAGGSATVTIRYANGSGSSRTGRLVVNGVGQPLTTPATGAWNTWQTMPVPVTLTGGTANTIRFETTGQDLANIDHIVVATSGGGDTAPVVMTQPASQTVSAGGSATFSVAASGTQPLSYQWRHNGVAIPGATGASYTISNAQAAHAGQYTVVVSNAVGSATSDPATLTVRPPGTEPTRYEAESGTLGGGTRIDSEHQPFTGTGYVNLPATGGWLQFNNVNGGGGGNATVTIRYANGSGSSRTGRLVVNGVGQPLTTPATGAWNDWQTMTVSVSLTAGTGNTLRFETTGQDLANIDHIVVATSG